MHLRPILSTLRRHKTAALLIVLEIAVTCAIVSNTVFLVRERLARVASQSGVVEDELVRVQLTAIGDKPDAESTTAEDLRRLRALPGVRAAAVANMVPFGNSSWNTSISTVADDPSAPNAAMYFGSAELLEAMGTSLIAGRDFTAEEYITLQDLQEKGASLTSVILTRALAQRLFPDRNPLGQPVHVLGKNPQTVVGIVEELARPNEGAGKESAAYSLLLPMTAPYTTSGNYLLRVEPARRTEVLAAIDSTLRAVDQNRIVLERQTFAEVRSKYFSQDRSVAWLLSGVSIALLLVTALGIVGLASFWVQQRTRQIGIRRALGASRSDILAYFHLENFVLATAGIVLGLAMSFAINLWLMSSYQVPRLPMSYLPIAAGLLWLVGQLAVLGPALRATRVSPAIATRSS